MAAPFPETVGRRVIAARMRRGVRQAELARAIKISVNALVKIEKGVTKNPSSHVIRNIAQVLRVSTDYLLGLEEAPASDDAPRAVITVGAL